MEIPTNIKTKKLRNYKMFEQYIYTYYQQVQQVRICPIPTIIMPINFPKIC